MKFFIFWMLEKWSRCYWKKQNDCALEIFNHNSHLPHLSAKKNFFENSLNTFEVIAFLPGQCKGKNWNFYIFRMLEKLCRCHCKTKISVTLKFSTRIATFLVFQPKKFFENWLNTFDDIAFLKYFWRYSFSKAVPLP